MDKQDVIVNDCLIINLDNRTDLWNTLENFRNSWEKNNKKWHRIQGVDYRNKTNVINEFIMTNRINLNGSGFRNSKNAFLGELGCFMGHYNSWKYVIDNKLENCLILEDGIEFLRNDFENLLINKNVDILFVNEEMKMIGEKQFIGYGLQGYIITQKGAEFLMKHCYTLSVPIDLQIRHLCNTENINATVIKNPYIKRNNNRLSSIGIGIGMDIIHDFDDPNKKQNQNSIIQRILQNLLDKNINIDEFI
jgi:hypothetical protein